MNESRWRATNWPAARRAGLLFAYFRLLACLLATRNLLRALVIRLPARQQSSKRILAAAWMQPERCRRASKQAIQAILAAPMSSARGQSERPDGTKRVPIVSRAAYLRLAGANLASLFATRASRPVQRQFGEPYPAGKQVAIEHITVASRVFLRPKLRKSGAGFDRRRLVPAS